MVQVRLGDLHSGIDSLCWLGSLLCRASTPGCCHGARGFIGAWKLALGSRCTGARSLRRSCHGGRGSGSSSGSCRIFGRILLPLVCGRIGHPYPCNARSSASCRRLLARRRGRPRLFRFIMVGSISISIIIHASCIQTRIFDTQIFFSCSFHRANSFHYHAPGLL